MFPRSAPWILVGALLALSACDGGTPPPAKPNSTPSPGVSPEDPTLSHVGQLMVDLVPLRDGLAASAHTGAPRGVRRVLQSEHADSENTWVATAQRAPVLFRSSPEDCPSCAVLEADVEVQVSQFTPPLTAGQHPSTLGSGRAHVVVPVKVLPRPSMTLPGWWELALVLHAGRPPEVEWTSALPTTGAPGTDKELKQLGDEVIRAEALLLPGRSTLMKFSPWRTVERDLRANATSVVLSSTRLTLSLEVARPISSDESPFPPPSPVVVLGHEFQLQVQADVAAALTTESALSRFRLEDARGRVGVFLPAGTQEGTVLLGGTFIAKSGRQTPVPSNRPPRAR